MRPVAPNSDINPWHHIDGQSERYAQEHRPNGPFALKIELASSGAQVKHPRNISCPSPPNTRIGGGEVGAVGRFGDDALLLPGNVAHADVVRTTTVSPTPMANDAPEQRDLSISAPEAT